MYAVNPSRDSLLVAVLETFSPRQSHSLLSLMLSTCPSDTDHASHKHSSARVHESSRVTHSASNAVQLGSGFRRGSPFLFLQCSRCRRCVSSRNDISCVSFELLLRPTSSISPGDLDDTGIQQLFTKHLHELFLSPSSAISFTTWCLPPAIDWPGPISLLLPKCR
jgi:hypothetical protein